jgi:hypothetical protein
MPEEESGLEMGSIWGNYRNMFDEINDFYRLAGANSPDKGISAG